MSHAVTFSGHMSTNGAVAAARFTAFSLDAASAETLVTIRNRLGSGKPINFTFRGHGLLDRLAELEAIECLQVTNGGQPYGLSDGTFAAVARVGELVQIAATLADGTDRSETGIVTSLVANVSGGKLGQSIDFVFYPCSTLRFTGSSTVITVPGA